MLTAADIEKVAIKEGEGAPRLVASIRGRVGGFEFIFAQHTVAAMRNNQKMMKRVIASRQNSRDSFEEAA